MEYQRLQDIANVITGSIANNTVNNLTNLEEILEEGHKGFLSAKSLVAILILIIYTISTPIFEKCHFHYIHESGICMLLGLFVGIIAMVINPKDSFANSLEFDDEVFFNFVLPPIIFSAGYNLKKKSFFKYFFYITMFGVIGTLVTFGVVAPLTYYANLLNFFGVTYAKIDINFKLKEILLFASVISATDTVAALTFIKEHQDPKLFSILFGEGVINDAVCIVLYRIIKLFNFEEEGLSFSTILSMVGSFLLLFLISTIAGIIGGLTCALFLKKLKYFHLNRTQESSLIIFFAFLTYSCTELLGYSPIIALLFCGIFMSQYAFYNLSFQAREESSIVAKIMSNIAEGFVFTYLGLTAITISLESFSLSFIFFVLIFVLLGRFLSIYGISFLLSGIRCPYFEFASSDRGIMCFAGCIRGAIAFGLAISIQSADATHKNVLISSTLVLVFLTTIVFGAVMPMVVKMLKNGQINGDNSENTNSTSINETSESEEIEKYSIARYEKEGSKDNILKEEQGVNKISHKIKGLWRRFDENIMKPFFIEDWPNVKEDHDKISNKIIKVFAEHQMKKFKSKELQDLSVSLHDGFERGEALLRQNTGK